MRNIARFIALILISPFSIALADTQPAFPNPDLAPDEVVHIVIDALKSNDSTKNDDGIATVFEFASPANKSVTGPISRFTKMIKNGFHDMLNHVTSEYGEISIRGNTALQAVWLTSETGTKTGYVFHLGKQTTGVHEGMWMTESVWPIGADKQLGEAI